MTSKCTLPAIVFLTLAGCGGSGSPTGPQSPTEPETPVATTVTLSSSAVALSALGESEQLIAAVSDQNGAAMGAAPVEWASSDSSLASVSSTGLVTAIASGTATITATSGSATESASVTVQQVPTSITLSASTFVLVEPGDTARVTASVSDAGGSEVASPDLTWSSDDPGVATVSSTGLVTAVSAGSTAVRVEATGGGGPVTESTSITVYAPPTSEAGLNQTVLDADESGAETVILNGSGSSDADGTISSYQWTEGSTLLGSGASISLDLLVGTYTITLTVTDNDGLTATDQVTITVSGNAHPTANAGPDQAVVDVDLSGSEVLTLDGSGSSDPDGTIVSYVWTEGATVLGNTVSLSPTFLVGVHTVVLTVTDDEGVAETDQVTITVAGNAHPTADAGEDQIVLDFDFSGSESVNLDGSSSSDPDGTIASYEWTEGATVLGNSASISPDLSVGPHTITLTVTDDEGATATDQVVITVNQRPTADAGADEDVPDSDDTGSETVTLDGSGSSDPDGTIASYEWAEGATVLGTAASISPDFPVGVHTITLTVTDDKGATATDQVTITIIGNARPIADAGADQSVLDVDATDSETVTLDGSGSSDPDGTITSYEWTEGATVLGTGTSISPDFAVGEHTVTLTVTDDGGATATDQVTITVNPLVLEPAQLCSNYPGAAIASFEDDVLESGVRSALMVGPQDDLTCTLVSGLTEFADSASGIASVVGMQNLTGLTDLTLEDQPLSDLSSLSGLTSLITLRLSNNSISNVAPLGGLSNLTRLEISDNSIADVDPLSTLTSLTELSLTRNSIVTLGGLSTLTSLRKLYLGSNSISEIDGLSSLTSLTELHLNNMSISDLSELSALTSLTVLYMPYNNVVDISDLSGLTSLTVLYLSFNSIVDISDLSGLTSLSTLHLEGNDIVDVSPIGGLTGLAVLYLYENLISNISALDGLTSLTQLQLQDNSIVDVSALSGLTSLTGLRLENNVDLIDIQPLLDNSGLTEGDTVNLTNTSVLCTAVDDLELKGVTVSADDCK